MSHAHILRSFFNACRLRRYDNFIIQWKRHEVWYDPRTVRTHVLYNWLKRGLRPSTVLWDNELKVIFV